jgi:hypothetical protein
VVGSSAASSMSASASAGGQGRVKSRVRSDPGRLCLQSRSCRCPFFLIKKRGKWVTAVRHR